MPLGRPHAYQEKLSAASNHMSPQHDPSAKASCPEGPAAALPAGPAGYELVEEIGRGGMGIVYRAVDVRLNRDVAVKLLAEQACPDSAATARFVTEAKITAQLQHPGIPAVHELGTLADGRPFLAMKLIKGSTLQSLLRQRSDPRQERGRFVAIFEQLCHAVGYAHAHGVIHRDLKPSNVMVGAFGEVQVMDWGLAKVLSQSPKHQLESPDELASTVAHVTRIDTPEPTGSATQTGSLLGTPAYMAPEQAAGEIRKLNPQSDVFGLGAILCEILTGSPPYRGKDANELRVQAVRCETAAALAALDVCDAEPELVALCKRCLAFRQDDRPADGAAVAGEVARIRQASEERARRAELERAEALVRAAEQAKRRRVWLGLAASLTVGLVASSLLGVWADQARREAERARLRELQRAESEARARREAQRATEAEKQARLKEAQERKYAQAIADFVSNDILALSSLEGQSRFAALVHEELDPNISVRQLLDRAAEKLRTRRDLDPRIEAQLCWMIGVNYRALGEYDHAVRLLERSCTLRKKLFGADHESTLSAQNSLAVACQGAGQLDRALRLLEKTLPASEAKLGHDHAITIATRNNLALAYQAAAQSEKALPLYEETLKALEATLGHDHPNTLTCRNNLAGAYKRAGKLDKALQLLEETLRASEAKLGQDHPFTLTCRNNLAGAYQDAGQLEKALPLLEEVLRTSTAKLGRDHPDTLTCRNNLATAYQAAGQLDKALPLYEETLQAREAMLGPDHPYTLTCRNNLAVAYQAAGQLHKALPLYEETLQAREAMLGPDHPDTLTCRNNLAAAYQAAGQLDKALPLYEQTLKAFEATLGPDHPDTLTSRNNLAVAYQAAGQLDKALPLLEQTLKARETTLGHDHPYTLTSRNNLAVAYQAAGQLEKSLALLEQVAAGIEKRRFQHEDAGRIIHNTIRGYEQAQQFAQAEVWRRKWLAVVCERAGADSPAYAAELAALGWNLLQQQKWAEAEAVLKDCLAKREKQQPQAWGTFNTKSMLGAALVGQEKYSEAETLLLNGYEGMQQRVNEIPAAVRTERLAEARDRLVRLYEAWGKPEEATKWREK